MPFYVYKHSRPDTGECFYIGKGYGKRLNRLACRNKHYTAIVLKLRRMGLIPQIEIVRASLREAEAFALERELIAFYGRADLGRGPLANQTDGGEGGAGYICPVQRRRQISREQLGNKNALGYRHTPEFKKALANRNRERVVSNEYRARLSLAQKARRAAERGTLCPVT